MPFFSVLYLHKLSFEIEICQIFEFKPHAPIRVHLMNISISRPFHENILNKLGHDVIATSLYLHGIWEINTVVDVGV